MAVFSGGGTGGHLYPALALCQALRELRPDVRPFFVGAGRGLEARLLPERKVDHILLPVAGLEGRSLWARGAALLALVRSLFVAGEAFHRLRPRVVVVTGGYAGGPAGILAVVMGIPLALQEQNARPGLTTRVLSRWARQIHLAFPEALEALPAKARARARVSGNPIREPDGGTPPQARRRFGLDPGGPVLLVVGGSQGAQVLNEVLLEAVKGVMEGWLRRPAGLQVLWSTGPRHVEKVGAELAKTGSPEWVRILGFLEDMPTALRAATLAVSRAGAMTTSEFLAWGVPSILVPLPSSAGGHQARNAESLARAGAALCIPQDELTPRKLWDVVVELLEHPAALEVMRARALERSRPRAGREIASSLASFLPPPVGRGTRGWWAPGRLPDGEAGGP